MYIDAHTHALRRNAVVDIDPVVLAGTAVVRPVFLKGYMYSVGIHPWNVFHTSERALRLLRSLAASPSVVAIGECGLDPVGTGTDRAETMEAQMLLLRRHVALSETLRRPLILHIVRAYPEIICLKKEMRPAQRWIIHGFRGKPQLARELLGHGFTLSYGRRYNPESMAVTPPGRLLRESDSPAASLPEISGVPASFRPAGTGLIL